MASYVKFNRGSQAAYNALTTKDPNSLYFISEKDAKNGVLYLGDKTISALPDGKVLSNNANGELTLVNFGTSYIDATGNTINNFKEGLQPKVIKNGDDYKIAWYEPSSTTIEDVSSQISTIKGNIESINTNITTLQTNYASMAEDIGTLQNDFTVLTTTTIPNLIKTEIADNNLLSYKIVASKDEISTIELENKERYIFLVPFVTPEGNDKYEEWMYLKDDEDNYTLEKVGDWDVDLSDYVTTSDLDTALNPINSNINSLIAATEDLATIRTNITNLQTATEDLSTVRTNITDLQTEVGTHGTAITGIQSTLTNDVLPAITWAALEDPINT